MPENINTFTPHARLTKLERLCALSFLSHRHAYRIFSRRRPDNLPPGATWVGTDNFLSAREDHTVDAVRWEFLAREGGVWVDADIVCLRPVEIAAEFQCAFSDVNTVSPAFVKAPPGHPIVRIMRRGMRHPVVFSWLHPETWRQLPPWRPHQGATARRLLGAQLGGAPEFTRVVLRRRESLAALPPYYFFPVREADAHALYDEPVAPDAPPYDGFGVCLFADRHGDRAVHPESMVARLLRRYAPD